MSDKVTSSHSSSSSELPQRRVILDVLILFFGISAWLGINSSFVQLPLLVLSSPEGWSLGSYMVIVIQLGNLSPFLYIALQRWKLLNDTFYIVCLLIIAVIGAILFGFIYDKNVNVFNESRSLPLLVVIFGFALVGCTSSVLFMPYMGRFKEKYLITYLIGEGLGGFLPSILALIQGVGGNAQCIPSDDEEGSFDYYTPPPRFGIQVFFIIISIIYLISTIAFVLIDRLDAFKSEYSIVDIGAGNDYKYKDDDEETTKIMNEDKLSKSNFFYLLILMAMICFFTNGVFPSIQAYSCLPYGNIAYHFSVTFSVLANPAACFLAFYVPHKSVKLVNILSISAALFAVYALLTAMTSPPPLMDSGFGSTLVVSFSFLLRT